MAVAWGHGRLQVRHGIQSVQQKAGGTGVKVWKQKESWATESLEQVRSCPESTQ